MLGPSIFVIHFYWFLDSQPHYGLFRGCWRRSGSGRPSRPFPRPTISARHLDGSQSDSSQLSAGERVWLASRRLQSLRKPPAGFRTCAGGVRQGVHCGSGPAPRPPPAARGRIRLRICLDGFGARAVTGVPWARWKNVPPFSQRRGFSGGAAWGGLPPPEGSLGRSGDVHGARRRRARPQGARRPPSFGLPPSSSKGTPFGANQKVDGFVAPPPRGPAGPGAARPPGRCRGAADPHLRAPFPRPPRPGPARTRDSSPSSPFPIRTSERGRQKLGERRHQSAPPR